MSFLPSFLPPGRSVGPGVGHPRCSPIPEEMTEAAATTPLLYSLARAAFAIPTSPSVVSFFDVVLQAASGGLEPSVRPTSDYDDGRRASWLRRIERLSSAVPRAAVRRQSFGASERARAPRPFPVPRPWSMEGRKKGTARAGAPRSSLPLTVTQPQPPPPSRGRGHE